MNIYIYYITPELGVICFRFRPRTGGSAEGEQREQGGARGSREGARESKGEHK